MTIYGQSDGLVVGAPLNPNFGAANGAQAPSAGFVSQPTTAPVVGGMQATGVQMTLLEAVSRGIIPRNQQLNTIAGQAVSGGISALQGDSVSLDEAFASGNGAQVNLGVAVAPNAGNNVAGTLSTLSNQFFVEGCATANDALSTGPTPTNTESIVSAPLSHATTTANIGLLTGVYQG